MAREIRIDMPSRDLRDAQDEIEALRQELADLREAALHVIQVARYGNVLDTGTAIAALRRVLDGGT